MKTIAVFLVFLASVCAKDYSACVKLISPKGKGVGNIIFDQFGENNSVRLKYQISWPSGNYYFFVERKKQSSEFLCFDPIDENYHLGVDEMASSRAINNLLRRTPALLVSPIFSSLCYPSLSLRSNESLRYCSHKSVTKVDRNESGGQLQTNFAEVVKENTKSAWYMSVIVVGVGVTALMFYAIFRELFSGKSPNSVYAKAVERCIDDPKVKDALGEPIKAYGEESRRGRRGHVRHSLFQQNGVNHMRMQFHIQGIRKRGTVHLEVQENESGDYAYRYLFVQLEDFARNVIVLEDNRASSSSHLNNFSNEPILSLS